MDSFDCKLCPEIGQRDPEKLSVHLLPQCFIDARAE